MFKRIRSWMSKLDENGTEVVDETPVSMPVGYTRPPSIHEQIHRLVRQELSMRAAAAGQETFEEADDFDVGDDFDPSSPYEVDFDHDQNIENLKNQVEENKKRKRKEALREEIPLTKKSSEEEKQPTA